MEDDDKVFIQDIPVDWQQTTATARIKVGRVDEGTRDHGVSLITINVPHQTLQFYAENKSAVTHLPFKGLQKVQLDLSKERPIFTLYFAKTVATLQFVRFKEWAKFAEILKSLKNSRTGERPFQANEGYQELANHYLYDNLSQMTTQSDGLTTESFYDFDNEDFSPKLVNAVREECADLHIDSIELSTI